MDKIEELIQRKSIIEAAGGAERAAKQHASGRLTARERITLLFDADSFVETDAFAASRRPDAALPGDGVVTGYGRVDGRIVFVYAQDCTVLGGSLGEAQADRICRAMDAALKVGAPVVGMLDSGGVRIQEGMDALGGLGGIFRRSALASGTIPQITAVMGPCAGGAVYSPALSDFVFMVDKTSKMFVNGPDVLNTVTGEQVTAEALGGASAHNAVSGSAHFLERTDEECIAHIRRLLSFLPSNYREEAPLRDTGDDPNRATAEFETLVPDDPHQAFDMYDIIRGLADDGDYMDYMELYARNIITCFAHIHGRSVGIVANQPRQLAGCLDLNASDKAARFVRTCDAFGIPLLTLVDVPGFLPGLNQEQGGIIRHSAKLLYAYSEAAVPKITLVVRKSYGGAHLAMCCKELGADVVYALPGAAISVMEPESAAEIIFRDAAPEARAQQAAEYRAECASPYTAASHGMVDDVIHPAASRGMIIAALEMLQSKVEEHPGKRHGNIPL